MDYGENYDWKKKPALLSLRNQDWERIKPETEKINVLLTNIPTNCTSELNNLIHIGAKFVCEKIGVPMTDTKKEFKLGWEIRLEMLLRKLRQQAKTLKQLKKMRLCSDMQRKARRLEKNIQLEGERLKRYRDGAKQYRQKKHHKTTKENSTNK